MGGNGTNWLYGETGDDWLQANGTGANYMYGGAGNDTYVGGTGADHFVFNMGEGVDVVSDLYGAGAGVDTLYLNINYADAFFWQTSDGESLIIASQADAADGTLDSYVVVERYFSHPEYGLVDQFVFSDGAYTLDFG